MYFVCVGSLCGDLCMGSCVVEYCMGGQMEEWMYIESICGITI